MVERLSHRIESEMTWLQRTGEGRTFTATFFDWRMEYFPGSSPRGSDLSTEGKLDRVSYFLKKQHGRLELSTEGKEKVHSIWMIDAEVLKAEHARTPVNNTK